MSTLDHRKLYRLPWSCSDNVISWLEPTKSCNIYCEGCYSVNNPTSHKSLDQVREDLDVFQKYRNTDAVSVAGGEPLTHPRIVEIVRMIAARGLKPVVNTNGFAMTPELMRELKRAGMKGVTFHIDSGQRRKGWTGRSEIELNELRLHYAKMVASIGGLSCAFNATVYEHTLPCVPDLVEWAQRHIDIVQVMVFIAFRFAPAGMEFYVGNERIDVGPLPYSKDRGQRTDISSREIIARIRERSPETEPAAYLNGTEEPEALKWLLTLRLGHRDRIFGSAGPKCIELAQVANHLFHGRYLGYISPRFMSKGRSLLPLVALDRGLRRAFGRYLGTVVRNPLRLFRRLHMQSIMIIQPVDVLADGRQSMCDGCPDMTVWDGRLVWSCRLEEPMLYGGFMCMVPSRGDGAADGEPSPGHR
ncbi:MAG: radical SAM protein [Acidobacteriota bacterium]